MDKEQHRAAKAHLVAGMQEGHSWQTAAAKAGLQISQSNAYRLWQAWRMCGETALSDGRHGHPSKLHGEARTFLEDACRKIPHTPSSIIQTALRERFDPSVSVSQINRVRSALGITTTPKPDSREKNRSKSGSCTSSRVAGRCWESPVDFPPPIKRAYLRLWKQPSQRASSLLIQRCVWPTVNRRRCAVKC